MTTEITSPTRRFQIIDLMIMTAAMAFALMTIQPFQSYYSELHWLYSLPMYFQMFVIGIHLAGIIWLSRQRVESGRLFIHPGHWILGGGAINSIGMVVHSFITAHIFIDNNFFDDESRAWLKLCYFTMAGLCGLSVIVLTSACFYNSARWRFAMILLSLSLFCSALANLMRGVIEGRNIFDMFSFYRNVAFFSEYGGQICMLLTAIAVCIAVVLDRRSRTNRDWLHWIGLTAVLIQATLVPMYYLVSWFLPAE